MSDPLHFDDNGFISVVGELTIYQANAALEGLRSAFFTGELRSIDLARVTEVDTAGLQWLFVASRLVVDNGALVSLINHSQPVREALALLGIEVSS